MLPALAVLLTTLLGCWLCVDLLAPAIQADVRARVAGVFAGEVAVDGRDVVLRGAAGEAAQAVRQAWGVRTVRVEADEPKPVAVEEQIVRLRNIEFVSASAYLTPAGAAALDEVAAALHKQPSLTVNIAGHTDWEGWADNNLRLSRLRAESVKTYLASQGIAASRMTTAGFGQTQPVADNATPEGRQRNRRIEFTVTGGQR